MTVTNYRELSRPQHEMPWKVTFNPRSSMTGCVRKQKKKKETGRLCNILPTLTN